MNSDVVFQGSCRPVLSSLMDWKVEYMRTMNIQKRISIIRQWSIIYFYSLFRFHIRLKHKTKKKLFLTCITKGWKADFLLPISGSLYARRFTEFSTFGCTPSDSRLFDVTSHSFQGFPNYVWPATIFFKRAPKSTVFTDIFESLWCNAISLYTRLVASFYRWYGVVTELP